MEWKNGRVAERFLGLARRRSCAPRCAEVPKATQNRFPARWMEWSTPAADRAADSAADSSSERESMNE